MYLSRDGMRATLRMHSIALISQLRVTWGSTVQRCIIIDTCSLSRLSLCTRFVVWNGMWPTAIECNDKSTGHFDSIETKITFESSLQFVNMKYSKGEID